jgi:hypothetical protein
MADRDEDSAQLRTNLIRILSDAREGALRRAMPTVEAARKWQRDIMHRLSTSGPHYVGRFRGEAELRDCQVLVGHHLGVPPDRVADELRRFEARLREAVVLLDELVGPGEVSSADELAAIFDLCAWVHSEWVRIHPFANGNGRTARLWVNAIAMRYGLRPFLPLRPRPDNGYAAVCALAMEGDWQPTARLFRRMYREAVRS